MITLPAYFDNMFENIHLNHNYETRNRDRAKIARTVSSSKTLRYGLPNLLTVIPDCIKNKVHTHSMNGFTNYAKKHFCSTYIEYCQVPNCYICNGIVTSA